MKEKLFGEALVLCTLCEKASLPYSMEDGISLMLHPKGTSYRANGEC